MYLCDLVGPILENVEKLVPHLEAEIKKLLQARKDASLPIPRTRSYKEMIDWVLRADPRFLKDLRKGKPLDKSKSPFAKHIIRWWLDPKSGGDIDLPEDVETTAETLQAYNKAKQSGLNTDISNFERFRDLVDALEPYLDDEQPDSYTDMGLKLAFSSGPWKMYEVTEWVPGETSSLYPDQTCHRAFAGTEWCVKYKRTFETAYDKPYYLVVHGRKRFALINFNSLQYKNPRDRPIHENNPEAGAEFLSLLLSAKPEIMQRIVLAGLTRSDYRRYGDFTSYLDLSTEQLRAILDAPQTRDTAIKSGSKTVQAIAKIYGQWPYFEDWPEGKEAIQHGDYVKYRGVLKDYIGEVGRDPEVEKNLDPATFRVYARWLANTKLSPEDVEEVAANGRQITADSLKHTTDWKIQTAVAWIAAESTMRGGEARWPELEEMILNAESPRVAATYVRSAHLSRWPEAEPIIGMDQKSAKIYYRATGVSVAEEDAKLPDLDSPRGIVRHAMVTSTEHEDKEDIILQDLDAAIDYAKNVIGPWPELEDELANRGEDAQKKKYTTDVLMN